MKNLQKIKKLKDYRRKVRTRSKIFGTAKRPRLSVFIGANSFIAQIIDDNKGKVLVCANNKEVGKGKKNKTEVAKKIGELIAKKAVEKKISAVVFDRSSKKYHGRIKALADSARENGLKF